VSTEVDTNDVNGDPNGNTTGVREDVTIRPVTKHGLTFERHVELGRYLYVASTVLQRIAVVDVSGNYGVGSVELRRARAAQTAVDRLRSTLDDAVYREHADACAHVYYPADEDVTLPHDCSTSNRRHRGRLG